MRQVKTDLRGKNAADVYIQATSVLNQMQGNPLFPSPFPTLADLKIACDELNESLIETNDGGSRSAFTLKRMRLETVATLLKGLAGYVNTVAQGEEHIAIKAGFELRRPATRITSLEAPRDLRARTGTLPGTIDVRWRPVHGARIYRLFICTGDPGDESNWKLLTQTSNSRYRATDLAPLEYFFFRVEAMGAHDVSPLSDCAQGLSIGQRAA